MRACKRVLALCAAGFTFFAVFSQNGQGDAAEGYNSSTGLEMPSMPKMPAPPSLSTSMQMPQINMPSAPLAPGKAPVGNSTFYVPGFNNQGNSQKKSGVNASEAGKEAFNVAEDKNPFKVSDKADSKSLVFDSIKNELLTAGDISTLYDSGLFGNISSLAPGNYEGDKSSTVLLQKILENLEELKQSQKSASPEKKLDIANHQLDSQTFKNREAKILRFKINGYNVNDSITKVFFSEPEADGSFLLTGDRTYYVNRGKRSETFYILFKALRSSGSAVTFSVQPSVVQDSENTNSFVYRFASLKNLRAEKTGNLVVLHSSAEDLNVDLLLDIDGEK